MPFTRTSAASLLRPRATPAQLTQRELERIAQARPLEVGHGFLDQQAQRVNAAESTGRWAKRRVADAAYDFDRFYAGWRDLYDPRSTSPYQRSRAMWKTEADEAATFLASAVRRQERAQHAQGAAERGVSDGRIVPSDLPRRTDSILVKRMIAGPPVVASPDVVEAFEAGLRRALANAQQDQGKLQSVEKVAAEDAARDTLPLFPQIPDEAPDWLRSELESGNGYPSLVDELAQANARVGRAERQLDNFLTARNEGRIVVR